MRQVTASLLAAFFSLTLISPALFAADPDSNLPACCRRSGHHHCTNTNQDTSAGPALQQARCSVYPSAPSVPVTRTSGLTKYSQTVFAALVSIPLPGRKLKRSAAPPWVARVLNADLPPFSLPLFLDLNWPRRHVISPRIYAGRDVMLRQFKNSIFVAVLFPAAIWAVVFGSSRGIVHDPDHRPVQGAEVTVKSSNSDYVQKLTTDGDGSFEANRSSRGRIHRHRSQRRLRAFAQETGDRLRQCARSAFPTRDWIP